MMMFAFYAIVGYLIEQIFYGITGYAVNRGFVKGPASAIYGVGALLGVFVAFRYSSGFYQTLIFLIIVSIVVDGAAVLLTKIASGSFLWKFSFMYASIGALFGIIIIYDAQVWRLINWIEMLPIWLDCVLLLAFYIPFVAQFVDGVFLMFSYRKDMSALESYRCSKEEPGAAQGSMTIKDHKAYAEAVIKALEPYSRWLKAYPTFRKATLKKVFRGCDALERVDIKKQMAKLYGEL